MRMISKAHAKPGHSKAAMYRSGVFSPASDLEALVDAYGLDTVVEFATRIHADLVMLGDSIHNGMHNLELNLRPLPVIRKQNKTKPNKSKKPR